MERKPVIAAALAVWAAGAAVAAQDLSDAELLARFKAQRAAIQAAEQDPALGASRGLVLTNVAPSQEAAPGAAPAAAGIPGAPAATTGTATLTLPGAAATPAPGGPETLAAPGAETAPVLAHWSLPEDQQVNLQVTFAFDSSALAEDQKPKLRQICGVLDQAGVGVLRIVGHTDASGPAGYNQQLSVLRAEEVRRFFVNECDIAADRLQAIGVGEQFPYDDRDPLAGVNRRVEFQAIS